MDPEPMQNCVHGNQYQKLLSWTAPDLLVEFGCNWSANHGVDDNQTNGQTEGQIHIIV